MSASPSTTLSARSRFGRIAVPALVTCSLVATAFGTLAAAAPAEAAAAANTQTIGGAPIALTQPTDPEMGVITPNADAAQIGMYGSLAAFPVLPMHATVARNGHLITFGTPVNTVAQAGIAFDDWDPTAGFAAAAHTDVAAEHGYDSFCNSAVTLMDGRILMVSGQVTAQTSADMMTMLYDPTTGAQTMGADLAFKRWYVTSLRLPDSRILLLGGGNAGNTSAYQTPDDNSKVAATPEIGTGTGAWTQLTGASSNALFGAVDNHWWYPRAYNAPNGGVVGFSGNAIWTLDPNGNGSVQQVGTLPFNPKVSGSQVMYAPGKILIAGGGQVNNDEAATATTQAAILDVNGAVPTATSTTPMNSPRNWLNLTVMPNGQVLANGGTVVGTNGGDNNSVRRAEIYDPATATWTNAATAQVTRTYHSTSLMMPSGAVFTGGSGNPGPVDNFNAELYYPAYLFNKAADGTVSWASRPAITSIAGNATYGGAVKLTIGDGRDIASASLITLPSVTHSQNTDQRRVPLTTTQNGNTVTATLPGSTGTLPPGDYELTVSDRNGVPSAAQIITIRKDQAGLVTVAAGAKNPTAATNGTNGDAGTGNGTAAGTVAGTGTAAGTGTTAGTGAKPTVGTPDKAVSTVKLKKGTTVTVTSIAKSGARITHSGTKVVSKKASAKSAKSVRTSASWTVRSGLGSAKGYSLESVDEPGYYLTVPSSGTGAATLVKKSKSASFAQRATFSFTKGVMGHDVAVRMTSKPNQVLQLKGSGVVIGKAGESSAKAMAATFSVGKGLAAKR